MKKLITLILLPICILCWIQPSSAQVLVTSCNQAIEKLSEISGFHYSLVATSFRDPNNPWPSEQREPPCVEHFDGDSGYVQVTVERSVSSTILAVQQNNGSWERGGVFLRRIQDGIENFHPGTWHSLLSRFEVCDPNIDWYHHCSGSFSFSTNGVWQQYGHYNLETFRPAQYQNRDIIIQSSFYFNVVGRIANTPTPSPSPTPTISSTPFVTKTPTITPTPTPTECLSEEKVKGKIEEALNKRYLCADGAIEETNNEIIEINKSACLQPRPEPYLPRGLDYVSGLGAFTYEAWPLCPENIYKAILAAGYPLIGTPSQRSLGFEYLKDNGWKCYSIKNESHPYRFGRDSALDEVIIGTPPSGKIPDLLLGIMRARNVTPLNYPDKIKIRKGRKIIEISYKKSPTEMFKDLQQGTMIQKVGKMTHEIYTQILKQIPRNLVSMEMYGTALHDDRLITEGWRQRSLGNTYANSVACFPPKVKVKKDDEKCTDYEVDDECFDAAKESVGLVDAAKKVVRSKKKGKLSLAQAKTLSRPEEIKMFMKKLFAALDEAGWPMSERDVVPRACTLVGVESSYSPSTHYCGTPSSSNILEWQRSGDPFECPRGATESSRGWFQINGQSHSENKKRMHYAVDNAKVALKLWRKKPNWQDWRNSREKIRRALSGASEPIYRRIRWFNTQCMQEYRSYLNRNEG